MATFRKRSTRVQALVLIDGNQISKTFDNQPEAALWAAKKEYEAYVGDSALIGESHVFADVLEHYKANYVTLFKSKSVINAQIDRLLTEPWTKIKLSDLTFADLTAFRDKRLKTIKPKTMKMEWRIIMAAARKAHLFDISVPLDIFKEVELPKVIQPEIKRITPLHVETLMQGIEFDKKGKGVHNNYLRPLIKLALATAMRTGELLSLHWDEVDMEAGWLHVQASKAKNGYARSIPITDEAIEALEEFKKVNGSLGLSGPVVGATKSGVTNSWRRLKKRVGLDHIRFHDFRHEAISRLHEFNPPLTIPEIQSISGHREMKMLERYSHANVSQLATKMRSKQGGVANV